MSAERSGFEQLEDQDPRRAWTWALFGLILPIAAFALDAGVQIDPILWGGPPGLGLGRRTGLLGLRQLVVYALLGLSLLGTTSALFRPRTLLLNGATIALLTLAVLFALAHAIAYVPLLPAFVWGLLLLGLGALGFAPYLALLAWLSQLVDCLRRQARLSQGRLRWALTPLLAGPALIALALSPLAVQQRALERIRGGDPAHVRAGLAQLGPLARWSRGELAALYADLEAESQVRLRNHYLELFDRDVHDDMPSRLR